MRKRLGNISSYLKFDKVYCLNRGYHLEKVFVHRKGYKHLAFSLFLFDRQGNLLIQRRASNKIFPNLWTNTCCSHPVFKYNSQLQVNTRLFQEFGFFIEKKDIHKIFSITYQAICQKTNFIENELDDVYIAVYKKDQKLISEKNIDKLEISDFRWVDFQETINEIKFQEQKYLEQKYTPWFIKILKEKESELLLAYQKLFTLTT